MGMKRPAGIMRDALNLGGNEKQAVRDVTPIQPKIHREERKPLLDRITSAVSRLIGGQR